jgi:phenylacetate-CoA ligase
LTNLGRWAYPALRYRTGDLVRHGGYSCSCGRSFLLLPGGVLGRAEEMLVVRGVNIYPSTLADILHRFPAVEEYRVIITRAGNMDEIMLQVECPPEIVASIAEELYVALNLRVTIEAVESGSLPHFDMQARRVEDQRPRV